MTKLSVLVVAVMYVGTLVGCASTPPPPPPPPKAAAPPAPQIPSWVDSPYLEGGLVSSECVRNYKGQRSILISKAKLVARGELASQIETNVKAMAKDFAQLTETADGMVSGEDFERVLKQITDQNLMGSRLAESGYYELEPDVQYLCVMMVLDPAHTRAFYEELMKETGASDQLSNDNEDVLYLKFRAAEAQKELDFRTGN